MTLAKPLAGGLPIGAVLVTEAVADHMKPGDHGSTFAGAPLVTHVADYVVERISQPDFLAQVAEVGDYLCDRLSEINSPHIKDIRGRGLIAAVELDIPASNIVDAGYEHGLLLVNAGSHVLRFVPPLIAQKSDVDQMIDKLTTILESIDG
jgi:acetylornithine/succinyldiaminopimelate/putrescine aminotransferase